MKYVNLNLKTGSDFQQVSVQPGNQGRKLDKICVVYASL